MSDCVSNLKDKFAERIEDFRRSLCMNRYICHSVDKERLVMCSRRADTSIQRRRLADERQESSSQGTPSQRPGERHPQFP